MFPAIHSRPLSDKDPDIAPDLVPLRERLISRLSGGRSTSKPRATSSCTSGEI